MKKIILNLICIQIIALVTMYSQQVGSWELISKFQSSDNSSLYSRGIKANKIAISNQNSIAAFSKDTIGLKGSGRFTQPTIVLSTDGGLSWTTIRKDTTDNKHNFVCLAHPSRNMIVVTGDTIYSRSPYLSAGAFIIISRDGGMTWNKIYLDSNTTISSLSMSDSLNGALTKWTLSNQYNKSNDNIPDSIYITNDGWLTWKSIPAPENIRMMTIQICFLNASTISVFGNYKGNHIWRTNDGGKTWERGESHELLINQSYKFKSFNNNTAWLVGGNLRSIFLGDRSNAVALKSDDGGMTWNKIIVDASDTLDIFCDISFSDDNNGVLVGGDEILGDYSKIYRTKDGGKSWIREFIDFNVPVSNHHFDIVFLNENNQLIFERNLDSTLIYKYNDYQILSSPIIKDIGMQYPDNTKIEWTNVEGATKYRVQLDDKVTHDSSIFQSPVIDTIVVDTSIIIKTLEYNNKYFTRAQALNEIQESEWYVKGFPFYTTDYKGQMLPLKIISPKQFEMNVSLTPTFVWEKVDSATSYVLALYWNYEVPQFEIFRKTLESDTSITLPFSLKPDSIYVVYVWYKVGDSVSIGYGCNFQTTSITNVTEPINDNDISGIMLFPNPSDNNVNISFDNLLPDYFSINIFNSNGIILNTLYDGLLYPGKHIFKWDVIFYSSGTYFCKISSNKTNLTYKIIIVK